MSVLIATSLSVRPCVFSSIAPSLREANSISAMKGGGFVVLFWFVFPWKSE